MGRRPYPVTTGPGCLAETVWRGHAVPMDTVPVDREPQDTAPQDVTPLDPESLDPSARTSRYAVPMSTLLGGAYVAAADQVEVQPEPPTLVSFGEVLPMGDAVDGD